MNKNNFGESQYYIYREKKTIYKALFSSFLLLAFSMDAIFFGYFREIIEKIVVLQDFNQSERESFLVYLALAAGFYLLAYSYTNINSPVIAITEDSIILNSKLKTNTNKIQDLLFYEFIDREKILFHFHNETIPVDVDSVKRESLRKVLNIL